MKDRGIIVWAEWNKDGRMIRAIYDRPAPVPADAPAPPEVPTVTRGVRVEQPSLL